MRCGAGRRQAPPLRTGDLARTAGLALLIGVIGASPAAAADVGGTWLGVPVWLWLTFNLVVFLAVVGYFLVPPIARYLEDRGEEIQQRLERAREQREEVRQMQATLEEKIEALRAEARQMLERAEEEGRKDRDEILTRADEDRERLLSQTREELDHRLEQARRQLTAHAAALAAQLARDRLEEVLDEDERRRLFEDNLARLEGKVR